MSSVFSRIIAGELPGRFVWKDDKVVVFLTVAPVKPGHALVVPRDEVDKWTDLPVDTLARLTEVAQIIGQAQQKAWQAPRAGLVIAGFEVPHTHIHVIPAWSEQDVVLSNAQNDADPAALDEAAATLRRTLAELGHSESATA